MVCQFYLLLGGPLPDVLIVTVVLVNALDATAVLRLLILSVIEIFFLPPDTLSTTFSTTFHTVQLRQQTLLACNVIIEAVRPCFALQNIWLLTLVHNEQTWFASQ